MKNKTGKSSNIPWILRLGNTLLLYIQEYFNKILSPSLNPFYFTGAICFLLFWVLFFSGFYLYFFYAMTPEGAYDSVEFMTHEQKYYGGLLRSMHRYGSDALVFFAFMHLLQGLFSDRFRKYRKVAWISGVAVIFPLWFEGITGYVLVWDEKAKMIALFLSEWMDIIPIIGEPFSRNFLTEEGLKGTFFFVLTYLHLLIPLVMLIILWVHCMRISRPMITPPQRVLWVILFSLFVLSLIKPALSMERANLSLLTGNIEIDWFYLFPFPLYFAYSIPPSLIWIIGLGGLLFLTLLPWIIREPVNRKKILTGIPEINLPECIGCGLCLKACPFEAINIKPRSDTLPYDSEVEIVQERCAECGLCLPACNQPALNIGELTHESLNKQVKDVLNDGNGKAKHLAFVCCRSVHYPDITDETTRLAHNNDIAVLSIPCIGILGATSITSTLKAGAESIMIISCHTLDCHYREGRRREDISRGELEELKRENVVILHTSPVAVKELYRQIDEFLSTLMKKRR